jgi:hypothetical protein
MFSVSAFMTSAEISHWLQATAILLFGAGGGI